MTPQKEIWISPDSWDCMSQGRPIYRGTSYKIRDNTTRISSPENRVPVHMPISIQREIDDHFERSFGVRFRERAIFATGDLSVAEGYAGTRGEVRIIRPVAPFCFCWGLYSKDLYFEFMNLASNESIEILLDRLNFTTNDLSSAIASENEILLVGSEFTAERV